MKKQKISLCTVCMNRLHHLKKTLPENIKGNIDYGNLEFVVLDYNSKDGVKGWINSELKQYIESGILKYFRTIEPKNFLMSHSKNVVSKQASGDIICNVDADNFIGDGFANYVNNRFQQESNIYLTVNKYKTKKDFFGRICLKKEDFLSIRGYDESMTGYGFEDFDLKNRLDLLGKKALYIDKKKYLVALEHDDEERLKDESNAKNIFKFFVRHIDHSTSEIIYLFNDQRFFMGTIGINRLKNSQCIDNLFEENRKYEFPNYLLNNSWLMGSWQLTNRTFLLNRTDGDSIELKIRNKEFLKQGKELKNNNFIEIVDKKMVLNMVMFFSQLNNLIKMKKNLEDEKIIVNLDGYGETHFINS